jgi:hypothetical protein
MRRRSASRAGGLLSAYRQIHMVDRCLLVFMVLLLLQTVYSVFFPVGNGQITSDVDVVVRTSSASIFGYFISAHFVRQSSTAGQALSGQEEHTLSVGADPSEGAVAPEERSGIAISAAQPSPQETFEGDGRSSSEVPVVNCLQVAIAMGIGLFCLVALLVLRNLAQLGIIQAESDAVAAVILQFRDFISGCIGFLIGCPTHQADKTV